MSVLLRFLTRDRLVGLGLLVLTACIGYIFHSEFNILYAAPFCVMIAIISNISGLRVALLAAATYSVLAYMQWFNTDPARAYMDILCYFLIAYISGTLKYKSRVLDTLNGNVSMLHEIASSLDWLIRYWPSLPDNRKYHRVKAIHGMAVDFATLVIGSGKLSELIEHAKKYEHNPLLTQDLTHEYQDKQAEDKAHQEV